MKHLILGEDPQLRVCAEAAVWLKKIELFRQGEDERMLLQQPSPEDLAVHKALLQRLLADGDHLLSLVRQVGLPANVEGITLESVAATLELLRADYRGWHDSLSAERRAQILTEVFPDVPQSADRSDPRGSLRPANPRHEGLVVTPPPQEDDLEVFTVIAHTTSRHGSRREVPIDHRGSASARPS